VLIHVLLAVLEFFFINWLGKHSISSGYYQISLIQTAEEAPLYNLVFRIVAPTVYLVLTAALWYALGWDPILKDYWRVTVFYFAIRWAFNLALNRGRLLRWIDQIAVAVLAIALSVWVSREMLSNRDVVLPSARGLTDELWIAVIGFLFLTARRVAWPAASKSSEEKRQDYLRHRFAALRRRFGPIVSKAAMDTPAEILSYSIMIYETFNRPAIYQWIEKAFLFPMGFAHTLGPMQIESQLALEDPELVRLGVERVNDILSVALAEMKQQSPPVRLEVDLQIKADEAHLELLTFGKIPRYTQSEIVRKAAARYNIRSDYPNQVAAIFDFLRESFYKDSTFE
jgi:hypothetical protein